MKKEKTIKTHQRRLKNGKVITVHEHKASYDAAEAMKDALKKKGAGGELEALKNKKPVAQEEDEKSPYDEYGFTKEEFKEWYEGTGSKADKKVEKALRKTLGRKAYTELNDKAADSYKKGGADKFFNTSLKKMDSAKPLTKDGNIKGKEVPRGIAEKVLAAKSTKNTPDGHLSNEDVKNIKKQIAKIAKSFGGKVSSEDFKVTKEKRSFSYKLPNGGGGGFKTQREALAELLKAAKKLQKNNPNLEKRRPGGWMSQGSSEDDKGARVINLKRKYGSKDSAPGYPEPGSADEYMENLKKRMRRLNPKRKPHLQSQDS